MSPLFENEPHIDRSPHVDRGAGLGRELLKSIDLSSLTMSRAEENAHLGLEDYLRGRDDSDAKGALSEMRDIKAMQEDLSGGINNTPNEGIQRWMKDPDRSAYSAGKRKLGEIVEKLSQFDPDGVTTDLSPQEKAQIALIIWAITAKRELTHRVAAQLAHNPQENQSLQDYLSRRNKLELAMQQAVELLLEQKQIEVDPEEISEKLHEQLKKLTERQLQEIVKAMDTGAIENNGWVKLIANNIETSQKNKERATKLTKKARSIFSSLFGPQSE